MVGGGGSLPLTWPDGGDIRRRPVPIDGGAEPSSYRVHQDESFEETVMMKTSSRLLIGCVWALGLIMALLSYGCAV